MLPRVTAAEETLRQDALWRKEAEEREAATKRLLSPDTAAFLQAQKDVGIFDSAPAEADDDEYRQLQGENERLKAAINLYLGWGAKTNSDLFLLENEFRAAVGRPLRDYDTGKVEGETDAD